MAKNAVFLILMLNMLEPAPAALQKHFPKKCKPLADGFIVAGVDGILTDSNDGQESSDKGDLPNRDVAVVVAGENDGRCQKSCRAKLQALGQGHKIPRKEFHIRYLFCASWRHRSATAIYTR